MFWYETLPSLPWDLAGPLSTQVKVHCALRHGTNCGEPEGSSAAGKGSLFQREIQSLKFLTLLLPRAEVECDLYSCFLKWQSIERGMGKPLGA